MRGKYRKNGYGGLQDEIGGILQRLCERSKIAIIEGCA
jgi:hypothetical protein